MPEGSSTPASLKATDPAAFPHAHFLPFWLALFGASAFAWLRFWAGHTAGQAWIGVGVLCLAIVHAGLLLWCLEWLLPQALCRSESPHWLRTHHLGWWGVVCCGIGCCVGLWSRSLLVATLGLVVVAVLLWTMRRGLRVRVDASGVWWLGLTSEHLPWFRLSHVEGAHETDGLGAKDLSCESIEGEHATTLSALWLCTTLGQRFVLMLSESEAVQVKVWLEEAASLREQATLDAGRHSPVQTLPVWRTGAARRLWRWLGWLCWSVYCAWWTTRTVGFGGGSLPWIGVWLPLWGTGLSLWGTLSLYPPSWWPPRRATALLHSSRRGSGRFFRRLIVPVLLSWFAVWAAMWWPQFRHGIPPASALVVDLWHPLLIFVLLLDPTVSQRWIAADHEQLWLRRQPWVETLPLAWIKGITSTPQGVEICFQRPKQTRSEAIQLMEPHWGPWLEERWQAYIAREE